MKKVFLFFYHLVDGLIDRILAVIGVVGFAQFPQFIVQYIQRLGGHLDESRITIMQYRRAAEALDLTLEAYVAQHLSAENKVFVSYGEVLREIIRRGQHLEESYLALKEANLFNRFWVFLANLDGQVFMETCRDFTPGIPTTIEGLCYGLAGLLVVCGLYKASKGLLFWSGRKIASLFRRKPTRSSRTRYTLPV
mgnify:CR=1 FL=1